MDTNSYAMDTNFMDTKIVMNYELKKAINFKFIFL